MYKKILLGLTLASIILLTACASSKTSKENEESEPSLELKESIDYPEESETYEESKLDQTILITDTLYKMNNDNVLFSPLSLDMALGMLELGSDGETKKELRNYLKNKNYSEYAKEYIKNHDYYYQATNEYTNNSAFQLNNSLWLNKMHKWNNDYLEDVKESFLAEVNIESFTDRYVLSTKINEWIRKCTYDMIQEALNEEAIKETTTAILINTLYFEDAWSEAWNEDYSSTFKNLDKTESNATMISQLLENANYYENSKATAFEAKYKNGCSFIGILPKKEGDFDLKDLDLEKLLKSAKEYDINVTMPEFTYETTQQLETLFAELYPSLYGSLFEDANLTKMTETKNLFKVDSILQKCKIELDKNGTRAAAVTIIITDGNCIPVQREIKEINMDRPFAYMILDAEGNIAFIGKVVNLD